MNQLKKLVFALAAMAILIPSLALAISPVPDCDPCMTVISLDK